MNRRTEDVYERGFTDHVLVCTNNRDSASACCAEVGGQDVLNAVRQWLRTQGVFWSSVYVAETSCLGLCSEDGTAIAVHPRGEWYSDVTPEDVPDLLSEVFGPNASKLGLDSISEANSDG
jgi:(2Fe-2S) ferredoxin